MKLKRIHSQKTEQITINNKIQFYQNAQDKTMYNAVLSDPFDFLMSVIKSFTHLCFTCVSYQQLSLSTAQNVMIMNK
jgi:hypothetical protein